MVIVLLVSVGSVGAEKVVYNESDVGQHSYNIPSGTDEVFIEAWGAEGGKSGGKGGYVEGFLPVSSGDTLYIHVGGKGRPYYGGYNGGANGGIYNSTFLDVRGGGGGGASDIRLNGNSDSDRVLVAAGGGGGGSLNCDGTSAFGCGTTRTGSGGDGGASIGEEGENASYKDGGSGGDQTSGDSSSGGDAYDSCSDEDDNTYIAVASGGGGGGYDGGGSGGYYAEAKKSYNECDPPSGAAAGGGGGSNFVHSIVSNNESVRGEKSGNGTVILYIPPAAPSDLSLSQTGVEEISLSWQDNSDDEDNFNIYRDTSSGVTTSDNKVGSVGADVTTFTDNSVSGGQTYYYMVSAEGSRGTESTSNEESIYVTRKPDKPTNPSPANESTNVKVSIDASVDVSDPDGENIEVRFYRRTENSGFEKNGSDTVSGSGTAKVTWDSLNHGETYWWYAVADDGKLQAESDRWTFSTIEYPGSSNFQPKNKSFDRNYKQLSVTYEGSDTSGKIRFYNSSSGKQIGSTCSGLSGGDSCSVTWSGLEHGENWWHIESENRDGAINKSKSRAIIQNKKPYQLQKPVSPANGTTVYKESFQGLEVKTADPNPDSMKVNFSINTSGNPDPFEKIGSFEPIGNDTKVSERDDDTSFTTQKGETYSWYVELSDGAKQVTGLWNTTKSRKWVFHRNDDPFITSVSPEDGAGVESEDVKLEVEATDPEGDSMVAYFFDEDDVLMAKDQFSGGTASYTWNSREIGVKYNWKVNVSDGHLNTTERQSFRRLSAISYRTRQEITHDYSSIVTTTSSTKDIFVEIENKVSDEKKLRTYLSGVGATFLNGKRAKNYTVAPDSTKRLQIRVKPKSKGDKELKITTENREVGFNTSSTIPVKVREFSTTSESQEVSGIGLIHIFMLLLVSSYLYSEQL